MAMVRNGGGLLVILATFGLLDTGGRGQRCFRDFVVSFQFPSALDLWRGWGWSFERVHIDFGSFIGGIHVLWWQKLG